MRNKGLKENSITLEILMKIGKFLEETAFPILIWDFNTLAKTTGIRSLYSNPRPLYYSLNNLKRGNYIQKIKTKRGERIKLTPKGKAEIIRYKIKLKTKKPKWNGKWFGICWDVPEISKKDRNYLRKQLRWLGFKEVQKSFWVFPFDVRNEIKELIKLYKEKLMGDVRFLIIEKLENDADLRKYFKSLLE